MFVFPAFWGGVRLALNQRIHTPVPLSRKLLCLSSIRNMVSYVQFLFKFSLYIYFLTTDRTDLHGWAMKRKRMGIMPIIIIRNFWIISGHFFLWTSPSSHQGWSKSVFLRAIRIQLKPFDTCQKRFRHVSEGFSTRVRRFGKSTLVTSSVRHLHFILAQ